MTPSVIFRLLATIVAISPFITSSWVFILLAATAPFSLSDNLRQLTEARMANDNEEEINLDSKEAVPPFNVFNVLALDISPERPSMTVITQHYRTAVRLVADQNRTAGREHLVVDGDLVPTQQEVNDSYWYLKKNVSNWTRAIEWVKNNSKFQNTWNQFAGRESDKVTQPIPPEQDTPQRLERQKESKPSIAPPVFPSVSKKQSTSNNTTSVPPTSASGSTSSTHSSSQANSKGGFNGCWTPEPCPHSNYEYCSRPTSSSRPYSNFMYDSGSTPTPQHANNSSHGHGFKWPSERFFSGSFGESGSESSSGRYRYGSGKAGSNFTSGTYTPLFSRTPSNNYTPRKYYPTWADACRAWQSSSSSSYAKKHTEDKPRSEEHQSTPHQENQDGVDSGKKDESASNYGCQGCLPKGKGKQPRCEPEEDKTSSNHHNPPKTEKRKQPSCEPEDEKDTDPFEHGSTKKRAKIEPANDDKKC